MSACLQIKPISLMYLLEIMYKYHVMNSTGLLIVVVVAVRMDGITIGITSQMQFRLPFIWYLSRTWC